ncbi:glucokinase [Burkholderia ubonensis]|uniref:Glucokinase n=1 Tax=Burkholderia ubonensis TaxID=101571 RepID=A0A102M153_9BURK|nr:glucokinase [Burkholderia ubonensis]KUZ89725.1 glucokinase [Burkholderia ubonensis]KVA03497.1 glucokinase [Burkholderia ubonensis]KVC74087.1 glucokinase [Burkholderia ubonensis]
MSEATLNGDPVARCAVPAAEPRLLADIGGTHARFALETARGEIGNVRVYRCGDHAGVADAMRAFLRDAGGARVRHAAIAIANPVDGDRVSMTNHDWRFSIDATRRALGFDTLHVVNDFAALAMAVPHLSEKERRQVGGGDAQPGGAIGVLGAGTGLGVAALVRTGDAWVPLSGEGGHVSFAPADEREDAVLRYARNRWPHVSFERLAAGPGIAVIHAALAARDGYADGTIETDTAAIIERSLAGDARCAATLDCFCGMLGTFAGNLALTLGATGGIYIGGGVVPRLGAGFDASPFRVRFEAKGRFAGYLARIPTFVITAPHPAFMGVSRLLARALGEAG